MSYKVITSGKDLDKALGVLSHYPALGLDTETTGLDPLSCQVLLVQLGTDEFQYVFDVAQLSALEYDRLGDFLGNQKTKWVGHNLKFDYKMIKTNFGVELVNIMDTFIIEQVLNKGKRKKGFSLAHLVERYLPRYKPMDKEERNSFAEMTYGDSFTKAQLEYSAYDAEVMLPIIGEQLANAKSMNDKKMLELLNIECGTVSAMGDMELNGIFLNKERWQKLEDSAIKARDLAKIRLDHAVKPHLPDTGQGALDFGDEFAYLLNYGSPAQVKPILESAVGKPLAGTGNDVIEIYSDRPVVANLLAWRKASKLITTYGMVLYDEHVRDDTGRIHSDFKQIEADTGRSSSRNPNLQNIPRANVYRAAFTAQFGDWLIMASDYAGCELRIIAELSGEDSWIYALENGYDIHSYVASLLFEMEYTELTVNHEIKEEYADLRQQAKGINFGMVKNNAESKLAKFGETSARNGGGNPEPSRVTAEGVETRRRVCIRCSNELSGQQKKFCSQRCNSYWHKLQKGDFKLPGAGSGGNQLGEKNHSYKNGIGGFSKKAFAHYGKKCNQCGSIDNLLVHHKDHDRNNNAPTNWEVLCKRCHQMHHCKRSPVTGKYIKG